MKLILISCLLFLAVVVTSLPQNDEANNNLSQIPAGVWKCIVEAYGDDADLLKHVKDCIKQGGDVVACLKAIHSIDHCFPQ